MLGKTDLLRPGTNEKPAPATLNLQGPDLVVVAAGDIACGDSLIKLPGECQDQATSQLILEINPDLVLALGDLQYPTSSRVLLDNFYNRSWGKFKKITRPTLGNHDLVDPVDTAYFNYFGDLAGEAGKGYYSFDLREWHLISLNSNQIDQSQLDWLEQDLENHPAGCTLAYFHHPLYSSGLHGANRSVQPLWDLLTKHNVEMVLNGHDHIYERFTPIKGIRQFIVGTGGRNLYSFKQISPQSEARQNKNFGVLKLILKPASYAWEFISIKGGDFTDQGSSPCH